VLNTTVDHPKSAQNHSLTTHIDITTLLLSILLGSLGLLLSLLLSLDLSLDIISNTPVLASNSLLTLAMSKQLLVNKHSLLLSRLANEIRGRSGEKRRGGSSILVVAQRLDVLVRGLEGTVFGRWTTVGLVG
jgi:hypothetical protein